MFASQEHVELSLKLLSVYIRVFGYMLYKANGDQKAAVLVCFCCVICLFVCLGFFVNA